MPVVQKLLLLVDLLCNACRTSYNITQSETALSLLLGYSLSLYNNTSTSCTFKTLAIRASPNALRN